MKKRKIILLLMLIMFGGIFNHTDVHATTYMRARTAVYMRSRASISGKILDVVGEGKTVTVLGTAGTWKRVRYRGKNGYVKAKYLSYVSYVCSSNASKLASIRKKAIAYAKTRLGDKYSQKYRDYKGYADCSSLMRDTFRVAAGVYIGDWTVEQHNKMKSYFYKIKKVTDVTVGDQLYHFGATSSKNHTGLYLGNGYVLHATSRYGKTVITHYSSSSSYWQYGCNTAGYCLSRK